MHAIDFQSKDMKTTNLGQYLLRLQQNKTSGTLLIEASVSATKNRTKVLVLQDGEITYAGDKIPNQDDFVTKIGKKYKPNLITVALKMAKTKAVDKSSIRELLDNLVQMHLFTWKEIEEYVQIKTIRALEQVFPYFCKLTLNHSLKFDLSFGTDHHGFTAQSIIKEIQSRQKQWKSLQTHIYSMEAIPHLNKNITDKINDSKILKHLEQWVDNNNSLIDIAQQLDQDALKIANFYSNWAKKGWITFSRQKVNEKKIHHHNPKSPIKKELTNDRTLTILAVDDSPTVHSLIRKYLGNRYNIISATNAIEGLKILNKNKIDLVFLDVGLPNIDGLQMCKTIRNQSKFKQLPIIMLTGRDTLVDKLKGQIAGTTHYLTKPFSRQQLFDLVNRYVVKEDKLVPNPS